MAKTVSEKPTKTSEPPVEKLTIQQRLLKVQMELNVPKNLWNDFGNFYYRSLEGIVEAAKPLCEKYGLLLTITDEISQEGNRYYVVACSQVTDVLTGEAIKCFGYARETENKKGMDEAQLTGACSSYARKYACNGLFAIDDVKDADTMSNTTSQTKKATTAKATANAPIKSAPEKPMVVISDSGCKVWTNSSGYVDIEKLTNENLEKLLSLHIYEKAHSYIKDLISDRSK